MTRYLIDIRLMGSVRHQIRTLSDTLRERFSLGEKTVVPHITLAGPFSTEDEARLVEDFTRVCSCQAGIPKYEIGGYGFFDDARAVFVTITPDDNLKQFRYQLSRAISPYCALRHYDQDAADDFRFHATLAMKLDWLTFRRIKWFFRNQEPVRYQHHPMRATLLRNAKIISEYDFIQARMLSRSQALSRATKMRDLAILRAWGDENGEEP